ncbi:T9SS type A sorting domain-containing protein [Flavipsychrobacter stenotrophus]|nr:T9SS type A sorting domain-containing protein [Flavipsychrobacter stenotrophus]
MNKIYIILFLLLAFGPCDAQPANGSVAPDFTFTDINGVSRHLYSYLDSGKYVALDISATWCHPCWDYHTTGTPDSLYTLHDMPGDNTWRVFFIEGDGSTNSADLNGTGTSTQGDWVTGSNYPIIDPPTGVALSDFLSGYNINFFPTLLIICPNRQVYQDTLNTGAKPMVATWEYAADKCGTLGVSNERQATAMSVYPNPVADNATIHCWLKNAADVRITVANIMGQVVLEESYGPLAVGDHALDCNTSMLTSGLYFFTVYENNIGRARVKVVVE